MRASNDRLPCGFFSGGELENGTFHGGKLEDGTFHLRDVLSRVSRAKFRQPAMLTDGASAPVSHWDPGPLGPQPPQPQPPSQPPGGGASPSR